MCYIYIHMYVPMKQWNIYLHIYNWANKPANQTIMDGIQPLSQLISNPNIREEQTGYTKVTFASKPNNGNAIVEPWVEFRQWIFLPIISQLCQPIGQWK